MLARFAQVRCRKAASSRRTPNGNRAVSGVVVLAEICVMNATSTVVLMTVLCAIPLLAAPQKPNKPSPKPKQASALFPAELVANARANVAKYPWAAKARDEIVAAARPWMKLTEDELWGLPFAHTIDRSWMVWSNGHCPACKKGVPMYNWKMDALGRPWKTRCPHCKQIFPKNDFHKFYRSGLDEHGVFDPKRADRSLLINLEHPDASDPLHTFGVDDGNGYVEGKKRWRFIGAYLIYGQWKQAIVGGITRLAEAYVVTGNPVYARRAGILLDRAADLYPPHDFKKQGWVYERRGDRGYVSTWHDACEEVRQMVLAYDQVFEGMRGDKELVTFLSAKAKQYKLDNPKASFADIQRNIEERILRDTIRNAHKIASNYPRTPVTVTILKAVLDWPNNRAEINKLIDGIIKRATAVDGVTGEKGLAGYGTIGPRSLATFLGRLARLEPGFLADVYKRHPKLHQTFRFHVDTMCLQQYYPQSGDTGSFACRVGRYVGVDFDRSATLEPSGYAFLWAMYELTKDPAFVQVLHQANERSVKGLPYDLLAADPTAFQRAVADVIKREGEDLELDSVNKQQWHIAILRSGQGDRARAVWLDYDAGGGHSHSDGMNLGLFARGLDLMPDFGYPPVQFGGWHGAKFSWYTMPASHNTVVVDGKRQAGVGGKTTLWADGQQLRSIRTSAPKMIGGKQYERTVALIDVSDNDFYVVDVFRVIGGTDHAKFVHSHYGTITPTGLSLKRAEPYGHGTQMRNFQCDPAPKPGWRVDWAVDDRNKFLRAGTKVHLRYTDLTTDAQASTAEGWIVAGIYNSITESWIPRLMIRRQAKQAPLASTFVAVIEPYGKTSNIAKIQRLPLTTASGQAYSDAHVAVEVERTDGGRDLIVAADVENPLGATPSRAKDRVLAQQAAKLQLDGELCLVRRDRTGKVTRIALCRGTSLTVGDVCLKLKTAADLVEVRFDDGQRASVVAGKPDGVEAITVQGRSVWKR